MATNDSTHATNGTTAIAGTSIQNDLFDVRALIMAALAMADEREDGGDLSRVLLQIANRVYCVALQAGAQLEGAAS